jgi:hypothetical protein
MGFSKMGVGCVLPRTEQGRYTKSHRLGGSDQSNSNKEKEYTEPGVVVNVCNPSYSEDRDLKDQVSRPAWEKS